MRRSAFLILLSAFPSVVRSELLPIRTYTTADGLAANHVDCIVSDSRGFLWFCTPEGLSRFDGYHFVTYGQKEGLAHRAVSTIVETRAGEYLVGTARGISRVMNPRGPGSPSAGFATYAPEQQAAQNFIADIRESPGGKIWCATPTSLFEWSTASGFRRRPFLLPPKVYIGSIVEDTHGNLWIGTTAGIYMLEPDGATQYFTDRDGLPGDSVEMLLLDSQGGVWAATRGGLARISGQGSARWAVDRTFTEKSGLAGFDVKSLAEASDGTLWVGTADGISHISLGPGGPAILQNLTREQGLSDRQITALAEDQAGNIWAGTEGAGVMRIDRQGFATYREQDGLRTDRVFSVLEDRSGNLVAVTMAGMRNKSLNVFDGVRFHTVTPKDYATWGWNQILLQDRSSKWWTASKKGLCRYPPVPPAKLDGARPQVCYSIADDEVFRIFEDSRGAIWASAQSKEGDLLMRWDPETGSILRFPPRIPGEPPNDLVSAFAEDIHGNIWMGLYKGGLYRYDGRSFQLFQHKDGMPGGTVYALLESGGALWIAANGGLGRILNTSDEHPRIEVFDTSRGMSSDAVQCLVEDREGHIYAGTTRGVDRLDPKTAYVRHFSSGLAHGECTSAFRDRSGALWFATKQGLSRLIPVPKHPSVNPRVFITDLRIGGDPYPVSQLGETRISRLELKPSQNHLQVEFVGLDYEPGDVLRYSYKLEGADPRWSPPHRQLSVNYAALPGGSYHFLVKAVTSEGVESTLAAGIDFTVLPPLWRRWWFEGLAAAMVAALVFAGHRYRVQQMVNLERMRTAIATDLHDDIGASLSHIAVLSEVARAGMNGENQRTQESLQRVAVLARELVDSLSDVVWSIRTVPDGLDSLVIRMREFALDLLAGQGIHFELRPPGEQGAQHLSLQARRHLFLMFKECIHNVSRHSGCKSVKAEFKVMEREIVLTVGDDGIGMNPEQGPLRSSGGNGIPGMRRRAEILGGSVQFVSKPGEGCTVSIRLPLERSTFARFRG